MRITCTVVPTSICVQPGLENCLVTPAENHAKSGSRGRRHGDCMMLMNYEAHACLSLQETGRIGPLHHNTTVVYAWSRIHILCCTAYGSWATGRRGFLLGLRRRCQEQQELGYQDAKKAYLEHNTRSLLLPQEMGGLRSSRVPGWGNVFTPRVVVLSKLRPS